MAEAEVQSIVNSRLDVRALFSKVERDDLVREVIAGKYDILWFATHGTESGIMLSDGILTESALLPLVKDRFDLIVLNTCESLMTAIMLQNESSATVVCTIRSVPDYDAFQTGTLFAAALERGSTFFEAFTRARPGGNNSYIYLSGGSVDREIRKVREDLTGKMDEMSKRNDARFQALENKVEQLGQKFDRLTVLETDVRSVYNKLNQQVTPGEFDRRYLWAMFAIVLVLSVVVAILIYFLATSGNTANGHLSTVPVDFVQHLHRLFVAGLFRIRGYLPVTGAGALSPDDGGLLSIAGVFVGVGDVGQRQQHYV